MFENTGQEAWMIFQDMGEWKAKTVKWIATTMEGDHVIEEMGVMFNNPTWQTRTLRRWNFVVPTMKEAMGEIERRNRETKYIPTGVGAR